MDRLSIFVKSTLPEIIIRNKEIQCKFYPATGRYDILTPQGSLENMFSLVFVHNESIVRLKEPQSIKFPVWSSKNIHNQLTAFFPQIISTEDFSEDIVSLSEFSDQIDQGLIVKIPLKFAATHVQGIISGFLCFKLYDSLQNARFVTIYLEIGSWNGFERPPHIHSFVSLAADSLSTWTLKDDCRLNPRKVTFYRNGYQSWSPNTLLDYKHKAHISAFKVGKNVMENQDNSITCNYYSEMVTAITDTKSRTSIILGFTTHKRQFNRIFMDKLKKKGRFQCLISLCQLDGIAINLLKPRNIQSEELLLFFTSPDKGVEGLRAWAKITGMRMESRILPPPEKIRFNGALSGFCSWYYYYTQVTEQDMIKNLQFFLNNKGYPVNLIQLDDGYQTEVGDFTSINRKFPSGMRSLVDKIHERGYLAGLWIAPFFAQDRSQLFKDHPEWFLRDENGKLILGGQNWGSKVYALDISKKDVLTHVKNLVRTIVHEWNYDYIKIDFVYSSEIIGSRYYIPGVTRAEVYRNGLEFIRDQMGEDTILLGCGAPLGPSIGIVDAMRIGADTAAKWRILGKLGDFVHNRLNIGLPALKPAMLATIFRSFMHKNLWINDPDCVVVRKNNSKLKLNEIQLQLTIMGLSGGMIMFSDDLTLLEQDRLRYMKLLIPPFKNGAVPLDLLKKREPELFGLHTNAAIGERILLALLNWKDRTKSVSFSIREVLITLNVNLTTTSFLIYDFWKHRTLPEIFEIDERITVSNIVKHGCTYYAIVPLDPKFQEPILLSSDLHISQGCQEIINFKYIAEEKKLLIEFNLTYHNGTITLFSKTNLKPDILSGRNFETILLKDIGYVIKISVFFPIDKSLTLYFE